MTIRPERDKNEMATDLNSTTTDSYANLSLEEYDALRGKILAVHRTTYQLLGFADDADALVEEMESKNIPAHQWSFVGGPPMEGDGIGLDELKASLDQHE